MHPKPGCSARPPFMNMVYREILLETGKRFELQKVDHSTFLLVPAVHFKSDKTSHDIWLQDSREFVDLICYSLWEIFNSSIVTGVFPEEWKYFKVMFNKVKNGIFNNYSPKAK